MSNVDFMVAHGTCFAQRITLSFFSTTGFRTNFFVRYSIIIIYIYALISLIMCLIFNHSADPYVIHTQKDKDTQYCHETDHHKSEIFNIPESAPKESK